MWVLTHPRHQPAATWVKTTRYCKYSQVLLMMGENIARNVYSRLGIIQIYTVHLVDYFHSCITMHGFMKVKIIATYQLFFFKFGCLKFHNLKFCVSCSVYI